MPRERSCPSANWRLRIQFELICVRNPCRNQGGCAVIPISHGPAGLFGENPGEARAIVLTTLELPVPQLLPQLEAPATHPPYSISPVIHLPYQAIYLLSEQYISAVVHPGHRDPLMYLSSPPDTISGHNLRIVAEVAWLICHQQAHNYAPGAS